MPLEELSIQTICNEKLYKFISLKENTKLFLQKFKIIQLYKRNFEDIILVQAVKYEEKSL